MNLMLFLLIHNLSVLSNIPTNVVQVKEITPAATIFLNPAFNYGNDWSFFNTYIPNYQYSTRTSEREAGKGFSMLTNKFSVGMNVSFITHVEEIIGLPLTAVFLKPTIEYGDKWGLFIDNLYASLDCNDTSQIILYAEVGLNCITIAPFYRFSINKFDFAGSVGLLRIDIAGLINGKYGTIDIPGYVIDEGRTGTYGNVRAGFRPIEQLIIKSSFGLGIIKDGNMKEIGASFLFNPFIRQDTEENSIKRHLFLSVGASFMNLAVDSVRVEEDGQAYSYSTFMGNYLIGIVYEQ